MLPLEVVYAFDPVPPEPQHEEPPTPMSRSGDGDSDGSAMDVEANSNGMGDGGGVSHTPAYADWTLPAKDAHHIIGGQVWYLPIIWPSHLLRLLFLSNLIQKILLLPR